ncbi:MAG: hypothetical protein FWH37_05935 [Candidatus Bathyarchaeota archaeon]|nr:hypothetical protein [Candidatus Termiticorpusculum sp.]
MCPQYSIPVKIAEYVQTKQTVSNSDLAQFFNLSEVTAMNYLSRLAKTGTIKNVGKGIYQVGKNRQTTLKPSPELSKVVNELCNIFPMAKFTAWSIQMLSDYSHYMIGKDLQFIETSKTLSISMRDLLLSKEYRVVLNPEQRDFEEYAIYPQTPTFILERKENYGLTQLNNYLIPVPERLWVDLYYFSTRKGLTFDSFELGSIFAAMTKRGDVNFDRLLRYSTRRGIFREILIFLYELAKQDLKFNQNVAMDVLFGRRDVFKAIDAMVEGAKNRD